MALGTTSDEGSLPTEERIISNPDPDFPKGNAFAQGQPHAVDWDSVVSTKAPMRRVGRGTAELREPAEGAINPMQVDPSRLGKHAFRSRQTGISRRGRHSGVPRELPSILPDSLEPWRVYLKSPFRLYARVMTLIAQDTPDASREAMRLLHGFWAAVGEAAERLYIDPETYFILSEGAKQRAKLEAGLPSGRVGTGNMWDAQVATLT